MATAGKGVPVFKEYKPETDEETKEEDVIAQRAPEPGNIYFYHPDHLGTSTYLTDANGQPYQFFINLPFGETMAEQHSLTEDYETPYKFNAKELDAETGFYYYGARYYNPRVSVWLSTDPLMEDYPNVNPYVYCLQNPSNLVDPDGRTPGLPGWYVNYQGFYLYTSTGNISGGFGSSEYVGTGLPSSVNRYNVLESNNGVLYHKNTNISVATFLNENLGTNFNTKKEYDRAWESASEELVATAAGYVVGSLAVRFAGPTITKIISKISSTSGVSSISSFLSSALQTSKNGLSNIGRALQKHAGRAGSVFENITFSGRTATEDGMNILKDIFNSNKQLIDLKKNGTKSIYDKVTGRGMNVSRSGEFNGFRELPKRDANNVKKVLRDD